jgi:hypothetical protein
MQLHYGPSSYDDPDEFTRFVLQPGEERNDCLTRVTSNDEDVRFSRYSIRSRPGAHHLVMFCADADSPDGELSACAESGGIFGGGCWLLASQGSIGTSSGEDFPPAGAPIAPENQGLAFTLKARTRLRYNMHFINVGEQPLLRESWTNVYFATEMVEAVDAISFNGGIRMSVPPHTTQTIRVSCTVPPEVQTPIRIVELQAHMHSHGRRLAASLREASGRTTVIYENRDWLHPLRARFDSVSSNQGRPNGWATDGNLLARAGDSIDYECEIANDLSAPLVYSNEVYTGEMCNLFGFYAPSLGRSWTCLAE